MRLRDIRGGVFCPAGVASPPRFFLETFRSYWPEHYLVYNVEIHCWEIWKDLDVIEPDEHGRLRKTQVPIIRGVFESLDQRALDNLRYRRWVGLHFMHNSAAYLRWLKQEEIEAKARRRQRNIEMMAEGFQWARRLETTRTFS